MKGPMKEHIFELKLEELMLLNRELDLRIRRAEKFKRRQAKLKIELFAATLGYEIYDLFKREIE